MIMHFSMNSQSAQTRLTSASLLSLLFVLICTKNVWAQTAVELLQASAVQGGLVVVLGCDDTELLTALRSQDAYLVQGLDADPAKVEAARRTIQAKGLYGPVSVLHVDGSKLPYVDNLVNLLVVNSPCQVTQAERMRVLVPNGVLMEQTGGGWKRTVKPVPAEIDEWTHFLHYGKALDDNVGRYFVNSRQVSAGGAANRGAEQISGGALWSR